MAFAPSRTEPPPTPTTTSQSASRARATPRAPLGRRLRGDAEGRGLDALVGQLDDPGCPGTGSGR